jgi:hypothetical protein
VDDVIIYPIIGEGEEGGVHETLIDPSRLPSLSRSSNQGLLKK